VIGPCIGHGGMARIYRAEHEALGRQVALKVLTDGVEPGTEGRARFLREARIAAAIKHPNVVNIFDIGVENQIPYLVMELLVGQDLESLISSHGALSEHTIIDILVPVVAGLVAVHDASVVHRDLKPGNIFLSRGPNDEVEPKLLDFGISRAVGGAEKMRLTSTRGLLMGTPLYMSPEALLDAEVTAASDQYSLGVVLYECATGVNPFLADSVADTARRVTSGRYAPISEQAVRPSRRLQAIIERMMSLQPRDRYPDLRALGRELLTLAGQRTRITWALTFGEVAAAARAHHGKDPAGAAPARWRSSRSAIGRLVAAGAVGAATVVAALEWSGRTDAANGGAPHVTAESLRAPSPDEAARIAPLQVFPPVSSGVAGGAPSPAAGENGARRESGALPALPPGDGSAAVVGDGPVRPPAAHATTPESLAAKRVAPRPEVQEPASWRDPPDWIIEPRRRRLRSPPTLQIGTNDAPIFD